MSSFTDKDEQIINYVKAHFAFLLEAGFVINPVKQTGSMDQWELILASKSLWVKFLSDRSEIFLFVNPKHEYFWIGLEVMVSYLTEGNVLLDAFEGDLSKDMEKQYQRLAQILRSYWDKIQQLCLNKTLLSSYEFDEITQRLIDLRFKGFMKY